MIPHLAEKFRKVSVLVAGDVMLDEYILGSVHRISPEAPVPVLDMQSRKYVLGGAANVAANIAALGSGVVVTGLAALDAAGETLRNLFRTAGISTEGLVEPGDRCTICKTRVVAGQQQVVRIDQEVRSAIPAPIMDKAVESVKRSIANVHVVILSDYAKGLLTDDFCAVVIEESRRHGVPVIVDPKSRDFRKYRGCTVITPNLSEASVASGITIDSEPAFAEAGAYLLSVLPGSNVLITRGADGMTLLNENHAPITVPTVARKVYDVVGAGDTVIATLAVSLGAGIDLRYAMRLANIAAGIVVEKPGTATATVPEILEHEHTAELSHAMAAHPAEL